MAVIYTFPTKSTPVLADLVLISDSQDGQATKNATILSIRDTIDVVDRITAGSGISVSNATGNITIGNTGVLSLTAGTNVSLSGSTGNITVSSSPGSGTANKIPKWSNSSTLTDSIISQPVGNAITIAGNLSLTSGNYIQSPRILDSAFSAGSAEQILSAGPSGSSIEWTSTFKGDLNGTINTATTGVTQANAIDNTTIATTAYVNNKIGLIPAGLEYSGTWDANTNNPTLASGVGTTGAFYIVVAKGSTNLDGITDWKVGDWAIFVESGATDAWQKVDNTSVLGGSGTGQKVSLWSGSGTSVTLTDSIMTQTPQAGQFTSSYIASSGGISTQQLELNKGLIDGAGSQGVDGYVLSSTTVGGDKEVAWIASPSSYVLLPATSGSLGGIKTHGSYGSQVTIEPITTTSSRNYGITLNADDKAFVNVPWADTTGVPGGSTGSVQFKNSSSEFAGDAGFTFTNGGGVPKLTIGNTGSDVGGIIEIQSDENGAELKIGGGSQAYYTSIKGSDSDTANYNIILPPAGPGGNNKILESTSAGILSWIDTPSGTSYSAGTGLTLTGTVFSTTEAPATSTNNVTASANSLNLQGSSSVAPTYGAPLNISSSGGTGGGAQTAIYIDQAATANTAGSQGVRMNFKDWSIGILVTNADSSNASVAQFRNASNQTVGTISCTSSATTYATSSDYRIKENVVDMTGAVDRVKQLKPSRFNFIADPSKTVDGFLAHEAQEVVPESVTGVKDALYPNGDPLLQGIDQSKIIPLLTGAIKELIARIEELEAK